MDSLEILRVWHTWLLVGHAPSTAEGYFRASLRFLGWAKVPLHEVTERHVAEWLETFSYRSAARQTYFHGLASLFSFALRHGHIPRDPTAHIQVSAPETKEPRALTVEQYEAVKAAAYRHAAVRGYTVELLYYTGGRIGEICTLTWDAVRPEGLLLSKTKGGKERTVPWTPGLRRAVEGLRGHFGERERILPRTDGTVWKWVRDAGRDAGVENVHPHLFRSTAATRIQERGGMPSAAQKLLGHTKLSTTQRYFDTSKEAVAEAVRLL